MAAMNRSIHAGACACLAVAISAGCGGSGSPQASSSTPATPTTAGAAPTTAPPETPPFTGTDTSSPTSTSPTSASATSTSSTSAGPISSPGGATSTLPAGSTYLADLTSVEGNAPDKGSIDINGRTYPHSIYQFSSNGNQTQTQYDLRRQCDELTYTAGVTDDSASEAMIQFEVYGDGQLLKSVRLPYGQDAAQTVNVHNVLRLKLQNVGLRSTDTSAYAGWGDAAIRCGAG
jgi:hypothetical protein